MWCDSVIIHSGQTIVGFFPFILWLFQKRKRLNRICFDLLVSVVLHKRQQQKQNWTTLLKESSWNGKWTIKHLLRKKKENNNLKLTRMVFICSFLMVFVRPKNFFLVHWKMYHSDFGDGIILNGGGHVPPFSK